MKKAQLTEKQKKISVGDIVTHLKLGLGRVMEEWGSWKSCPNCYARVDPTGFDKNSRPIYPPCDYCHQEVEFPINVNGTSVVEVKFGHEIHAINKLWLIPAI